MSTSGWIGVDLDGTLAHYEGWQGPDHVGEPVPAMLEFVRGLLKQGRTVKIFTARACIREQIPPVEAWLRKHDLAGLEVALGEGVCRPRECRTPSPLHCRRRGVA